MTVQPTTADRFERVSREFDEPDLVKLTFAVVVINSWNRLAVSFRAPVGTYQPAAAAAPAPSLAR